MAKRKWFATLTDYNVEVTGPAGYPPSAKRLEIPPYSIGIAYQTFSYMPIIRAPQPNQPCQVLFLKQKPAFFVRCV